MLTVIVVLQPIAGPPCPAHRDTYRQAVLDNWSGRNSHLMDMHYRKIRNKMTCKPTSVPP